MSYKNVKAHALDYLLVARYAKPIVMWYVVCIFNNNRSKTNTYTT